jgi:hypothetical protein
MGTAGTVWAGTRIAVAAIGQTPRFYRVATDTPVTAVDIAVNIAVESEEVGPHTDIDSTLLNTARLWVEDPLWDVWLVHSLTCSGGTYRETDTEYRARWREGRIARRPGYRAMIAAALADEGAAYVSLFDSNYMAGTDDGICRIFVANEHWQSPKDLVDRCMVALEAVRVAGCDTQVLGINRIEASFDIAATLWKDPSNYNVDAVKDAIVNGIMLYFSGHENTFVFQRVGLVGAMLQSCKQVQHVAFGETVAGPSTVSNPPDTDLATIRDVTAIPMLVTSKSLVSVVLVGPP